MGKPFIRSPYNYDAKVVSDACVRVNVEPSLAVQSQKDDGDVNVILRRYGITGVMPVPPRVPMYGDFSHITDFRSALEAVDKALEMFMQFPPEIRSRFQNNPQLMLDFCSNDANIPLAREMGLIPKEVSHGNRGESVQQAGENVAAASGASEAGVGGHGASAGGSGGGRVEVRPGGGEGR